MSLLIAFLSLTNIALGYGLAIYLGHAQPFWKASARPARTGSPRQPTGRSSDRRDPVEQPPAKEKKSAPPQPTTPATEPVAEAPPAPASPPASSASAAADSEEMSLKDTLKDLEAFRQQVHDQRSPTSMEENLDETPEPVDGDDEPQEVAEPNEEGMGDDDLMKGIGAFQDQLKRQQELSRMPNK